MLRTIVTFHYPKDNDDEFMHRLREFINECHSLNVVVKHDDVETYGEELAHAPR